MAKKVKREMELLEYFLQLCRKEEAEIEVLFQEDIWVREMIDKSKEAVDLLRKYKREVGCGTETKYRESIEERFPDLKRQ